MSNLNALEPAGGYRKAAISGGAITGLGTIIKALLQVLSIVVLARLLRPEDFGVMAMVFPLIAFATVFQEAGLGLAVIQRAKINDEELSTTFWLNVALGTVLTVSLVALAPLVAQFYNEPRVAPLTAAAAAMVLLAALSTQQLALLNRGLRFRELATIDVLSLTVGTTLAIVIAYYTRSYWAILFLSLGSAATTCLLAWSFSGWRPSKRAGINDVVDIIRFGGNVTLSHLAGHVTRYFDHILIGRMWGPASLGLYERAYKIVLLPILFVQSPLTRLVLPMLSQTRDQPERYRVVFLRSYQAALLLTVPGLALFIGASERVVLLVMGSQWGEAAPIFSWLAAAALTQIVSGPVSMLFLSQERSHEARNASVASAVYFTTAFAVGVHWGAVGVAAAYAISSAVRIPTFFWFAARTGPVRPGDLWSAIIPFIPAALVSVLIVQHLTPVLGQWLSPVVLLGTLGVLVYMASVPCLLLNRVGRELLHEGARTLRTLRLRR